ncbi:hypothetical protein ACFL54_04035 [Planctomycetota bacterium]
MTCPQTSQWYEAWMLQEFSPTMQRHLEECEKCRRVISNLKQAGKNIHLLESSGNVKVSPGFRDQVWQECRNQDEPVTGARFSLLKYTVIAAVCLLAIWVGISQIMKNRPPANTDIADTGTVAPRLPKNIPTVRVLDIIHAGRQFEALLQDLQAVDTVIARAGDRIGDYDIVSVQKKNIILKKDKEPEFLLDSSSYSAEINQYLSALVNFYSRCLRENSMTDEDFRRLARLAFQGEARMLKLLEDVATDSSNPYYQRVQDTLGGGEKDLAQLQHLYKIARGSSRASRIQALRTLGQANSPVSRKYLRDMLANPGDELLPLIIGRVVANRDLLALKQLELIGRGGNYSVEVSNQAKQAIMVMSGGENNDKNVVPK